MRAEVELIAYADRFGGNLAGLRALLNGLLGGLFGGVHVLPFYRPYDGADAGFEPQDHTEVDARLGSWDDIAALSGEYRVMVDMIVNHVSSSSPQFQDWLANGQDSPFAGMFLTYGSAFPAGATEDMLMRLYRPRPGLPLAVCSRQRPEDPGLDDLHAAADRCRRPPPNHACLPAPRSGQARRGARVARPARRGRLCRQDARPDILHDPGNI